MSDNSSSISNSISSWLYDAFQRLYSEAPYRLSKTGRAFPAWHFFLELTRRCNLRCRMCQYITYLENTSGAEQRQGELTTEEWKGVIDQTGRLSFITFTGGEPLIREDFLELLTYAAQRARVHYITNATLLKAPTAEASVNLAPRRIGGKGLNFVGVSLEGPAELHDHIRQQPGAFDKSAAGIKLLSDFRGTLKKQCPMVHITTVIQDANVHALEHMPQIAASLGADTLNLTTETRVFDLPELGKRPPGAWRTEEIPRPRIAPETLSDALEKTEKAAQQIGIALRMPRIPRQELLRYYSGEVDLSRYTCRSPWNTLTVGRTGDAYPCWLLTIGNVRERSLAELWNNEKMRKFRQACRKGLFAPCPGCCFIEYR